MPATKTQIGLLALQSMKVVDGDATPDTNDTTVIEAAYDTVYAMLNARHLVSWAITGSVPDKFINPVVALTAASRMTLFTVPQDVQVIIAAQAGAAVQTMSEMQALDYVPVPIPSVPF
ncbi:MAG: hypothetical protein V3T88_07170 [Nitrosomonadaceae bacterium]